MALSLIILPLLAALLVFFMGPKPGRSKVLPVVAVIHFIGVIAALRGWGTRAPNTWLGLDALGGWVLLVVSTLFLLCAFYVPAYLRLRPERNHTLFIVCFLGFLAFTSLLTQALHPGLLWVAIESLTLTTARLIYFNHNRRSLEATWKYLMIGSVGIAFALLGTFFIAYGAHMGGVAEPLHYKNLMQHAHAISKPWLRAGFVLSLVGYGTKMGIAPLHTWKPDAYGETPGVIGALLAGGVTSCAFLALLRLYAICAAGGEMQFARELLMGFGLLSMAWALAFLVKQMDLKRLLAYSSVEHMGILLFGIGVGGLGAKFALFHLAANALTKSVLFLAAGNIHRSHGTKQLPLLTGAIKRNPVSGWLFLIAFLAITGAPPFAPFISEFHIAAAALTHMNLYLGLLFLVLLGGIFIAMSDTLIPMLLGRPHPQRTRTPYRDTPATTVPLMASLLLVLILGLWLPGPLKTLLTSATALVEGMP